MFRVFRIVDKSFYLVLLGWLMVNSQSSMGLSEEVDSSDSYCRILVVEAESGWPVPLIELRTTNQIRFLTDNAGIIALNDPSLMDREIWFNVIGHGYGVPADGFGFRGIRLTPKSGQTLRVEVKRTSLAKRIGRLTGEGLFAESQKLGEQTAWVDGPVFGSDSVQNAVYRNQMFWAWGDTLIASYPLGVFDMTGATTPVRPFASYEPPLYPRLAYFADGNKRPRPIARMPGNGPTWLTGVVSLQDKTGTEHLVAFYRKITPPLKPYEAGLCVWSDASQSFEHLLTVWKESDDAPNPALLVDGHPTFWTDPQGVRWLLFGNPLPRVRLPATFEVWQDMSQWRNLQPQKTLKSAVDGALIEPHSGSIAWNGYRHRWVSVFMQKFGKPSAFGTLWYAESDLPTGPWGPAVEILSHDNYTFYNPRLHPEFTLPDEPVLLFEGTYTAEFADRPEPTPRYNYNQILYRLDLNDNALSPSHKIDP